MRVLWLVNILLPEVSELINERPLPFGGWLLNTSKALAQLGNFELSIVCPRQGLSDIQAIQGNNIKYYLFPPVKHRDFNAINNNAHLSRILDHFNPDLVHIHGTEFPHTLAMVNLCGEKRLKTVISIQGLVSVIARHYMAFLPHKIEKQFSIRDLLKWDNLTIQQEKFRRRGLLEIEAIKKTSHIIGRTSWDKACTSQINPGAEYYSCNETIREEFYLTTWKNTEIDQFSIFVSQGAYPVKGLHLMLGAMRLIISKYPNAKLYIAGEDITKCDTWRDKIRLSSYSKYIKSLIDKNNLQEHVQFTGTLDANGIRSRYLRSHVFVCPSSIENSPNSLAEAMLLGVPCVASHVGGVPDMLMHGRDGFLYPADAPYMLAYYVCKVFENEALAIGFSSQAREHALARHDRDRNTNRLTEIYQEIVMS